MNCKLNVRQMVNFVITMFLCLSQTSTLCAPNGYDVTSKYTNIALNRPYTISPDPNYVLCTDVNDKTQLTDGIYTVGQMFWSQKTTVGWNKTRPVTITIDLGTDQPIRGVSYNTAANKSHVNWPDTISVLVSIDGQNYLPVGNLKDMDMNEHQAPPTIYAPYRFWTDKLKTHGRYIQLIIDADDNKANYVFCDEIEVYRGEQTRADTSYTSKLMRSNDYFDQMIVNRKFKVHLTRNLQNVRDAVKNANLAVAESNSLIAECDILEKKIGEMPDVLLSEYSTLLPLNQTDEQIYALHGKVRMLQKKTALQVWTSSPYKYCIPTQEPDNNSYSDVSLAMMNGEYRSAMVNLTNNTNLPKKLYVKLIGFPADANADLCSILQVLWYNTEGNVPVARTLAPVKTTADGAVIDVPAGMLRQVWFTFHPTSLAPATYKAAIKISGQNTDISVPVSLRVSSIKFPEKTSLYFGGWDYSDEFRYAVTQQSQAAFIAHLKSHFVNSPWANKHVIPFGKFNADNTMQTPDTKSFDNWINLWKGDARRYAVFLNGKDAINDAASGTSAFSARVSAWINFWVGHAAQYNIKPEQILLLITDEPDTSNEFTRITAWARAIHAAQPKVRIWQDINLAKPQSFPEDLITSADIFCPGRTPYYANESAYNLFISKLRQEGKTLEFYDTRGPVDNLDPYTYGRLQAWLCLKMGAEGMGFWSFSGGPKGSPWQFYSIRNRNYTPFIITPETVIAGKQMEAMREGVEDYEYMVMLKNAVSAARPDHPYLNAARKILVDSAVSVLAAPEATDMNWETEKDYAAADKARVEILKALEELQK